MGLKGRVVSSVNSKKEGREKGLKGGDRHQDLIRLTLGGLLESISPQQQRSCGGKEAMGPGGQKGG